MVQAQHQHQQHVLQPSLAHASAADAITLLPQTALAERLAGLLPQMQPPMARLYWGGLLGTLRREWASMDHHRMDKYLLLVRKFVAAVFSCCAGAGW